MFSEKKYSTEQLRLERTSKLDHCKLKNDEGNSITKDTAVVDCERVTFRPFLGLFFACLHSTFHQLASVIIKKLPYIDPNQLSLIRNTGLFVGILPVAVYYTNQILGTRKHRFFLTLRGFLGATALYFQIMAYSYLPLVEASIIMSTLPLVTALMARILLKEPYGLVQCASLILTVSGVLLVLKLPKHVSNRNDAHFDFTYVVGLMAAVGCVLFLSLSWIYIRKLKEVHFSVVVLYLGVFGIIENSILAGILIPLVPVVCGLDQILCILLGVVVLISNCLITLTFQVQPAGIGAVQKSSFDILIIIVFEITFFNIYPDWYVIGGACLVIASLTLVGVKNWILLTPETSKIRRNLKWLLL